MSQYTTMHVRCPQCANLVQIETEDTPDEISGNAGFVLRCEACATRFAVHVNGNIKMSTVRSGATVLDTYHDEVAGSREQTLAKHGLAPGQGR